jgi:hypothetical protein
MRFMSVKVLDERSAYAELSLRWKIDVETRAI